MKAILITIVMILPCFVFGQSKIDDYAIYSSYLKSLRTGYNKKLTYVVRISSDYGGKYSKADIGSVLEELRDYVKGDTRAIIYSQYKSFLDTVRRDTLWLPLFARLNQSLKKEYIVKNKFSDDLQVFMLPYTEYVKYFDKNLSIDIEDGWASFHENYPGYALLIDLSEIVTDGKRAVFYFSRRCGGLCGEGDLVLFYKDNADWRFVTSIPIWYN